MSIHSNEQEEDKSYLVNHLPDSLHKPIQFECALSIISSVDHEEVNVDNLWSYTITNVLSSTICLVSIFFIETINLSFVGYTNESGINLTAVGVGNIILNFSSLFFVFGALGAYDTVGSFCYGKKDYQNLKRYTIRMRFLILLLYVIITIPACFLTEELLLLLHTKPIVAERAQIYTTSMLISIFFAFNFNLNVRYLQVKHDYVYTSLIAVIGIVFHYCCNLVAFKYFDAEFYFVAYSSSITFAFIFLLSVLYIYVVKKDSIGWYELSALKINDFWFFIKLSIFSALQHYGDYIGYEIVAFFCVYLPDHNETAASLIILNYTVISGYVYSGSSYPLGQLVGYCLGKENKQLYELVILTYSKLNFGIATVLGVLTYLLEYQILNFYTNSNIIIEIACPVMTVYSLFIIVDTFNVMLQGVLRGTGNQHIPSIWNIVNTVIMTIPLSLLLGFYFDYGILGLWTGVFAFMLVMLIISFISVKQLSFHDESKKLHEMISEIKINDS